MNPDDPSRPTRPGILDHWRAPNGADLLVRPMAPDDGGRELRFIQSLSPQSRYERVFSHRGLLPGELRRLVHFDVRREIALIAATDEGAAAQIVAVARLSKGTDGRFEFAIAVADAWHRQGIGARLLAALLDVARLAGVREVHGQALATNVALKRLCRRLGFTVSADPRDATLVTLRLELPPAGGSGSGGPGSGGSRPGGSG